MSIDDAVTIYLDRQSRKVHPSGTFDKAGRWVPDDAEWRSCCGAIRWPSRAWPYSLMTHCRSTTHVAALTGVAAGTIRRLARRS